MDSDLWPAPIPTLGLAVAVNVPVGLVAYACGFFNSYMLNDLPDAADLLQFLASGLTALVLSVFLMTVALVSSHRTSALRAVVIAVGTSLLLHAVFLLVALPPLTA